MKFCRIVIALIAICSALAAYCQDNNTLIFNYNSQFSDLLDSIESNNTTLIALRKDAEARKLENSTGITLADPEIGFKRKWEGAEKTGNLTEFTLAQSIDLSIVLGMRKDVSRQKNLLVEEEYSARRLDILLEAELVCIDLVYYKALAAELDRRLEYARSIVEAEKMRLDNGDTDVLSYNNVVLSLSALEADRTRVDMECDVLVAHLTALNGGKGLSKWLEEDRCDRESKIGDSQVSIINKQILNFSAQSDFDTWYTEAKPYLPQLAQARQLREVRDSELALSKTLYLPSLSATYINERHTIGSRSQGVAVGVSLPLWENKNRVRTARTALKAAETYQADLELQLRSELEGVFTRVKGLYSTAMLYRRALDEANNSALLEKAMNEGFISVLEYLQGIELYYDYLDRSLSAEREFLRAYAQLEAWRL